MTTDNPPPSLFDREAEIGALERLVQLHLSRLAAWSKLPDDRTDWELETLLVELGTAATALRRTRGDQDLPF